MRIINMRASRSSTRRTKVGYLAAALLAAGTAAVLGTPIGAAEAVIAGPTEGILCETPTSTTAPVFTLDAVPGYVTTPDGNSLYMWGYTTSGRGFQLPGPTLCVDAGTPVTVVLHNTLREPVSIVFSGQSGVKADGAAAEPQLDASGKLVSLVPAAPAAGGSVTYTFTAGSPGTYLYSSGTDVTKQREMGLYGTLVVRPAGKPLQANADPSSAFSKEFLYMVSQVDPDLHSAVERNRAYDYTNIVARYFFINGRSMPDTLAPNNAAWLPSQPYGSLIHISADARPGDLTHPKHAPALIRYVNAGPVNYPFHPHGSSQTVVGRDGAPTHDANGADASYGKFLLDVGPGQSIDSLESWQMEYDPTPVVRATPTPSVSLPANPIPADIQLPQLQDQIVGPGTETWFSENPYLGAPGGQGAVPTGIVQNNVCGEYYHVAHSHALYQATNYGASFGGMMTLIRVDPPGNFNCAGSDY